MSDIDRRETLRRIGVGVAGLMAGDADAGAQPPELTPITRPSTSSGATLPVIGLGTWQTFDVGRGATERAPLQEVLAAFVEFGGRLLDSSPMYGASEEVAGDIAAMLG